jgi:DNA-binding winged helix-turn-helix (wHTH) protein
MLPESSDVLEFGPYRIDREERLLAKGNDVIPLPPKVFDTLLALVGSGGRILEKDKLLKTVWPDTFVEEGSLTRNISTLRKALGESPDDQKYIATVPKRGYRFVAPVVTREASGQLGNGLGNSAASFTREQPGTLARTRTFTRLIVLPFRMLRPDSEFEFLIFSLPDAITTSLSGLASLVVRSSMAAARYAGDSPDLTQIASEAEVDAVLTGTLLRSGDQLRVVTQLAEVPGGAVIWSQKSQLGLQDIFQLQDEIVRRVVESLSLPLSGRESRLLQHDVPASPIAYEYYLRANHLSLDWHHYHTARALYLKCVDMDPKYAPAWTKLGRVFRIMAKYGEDNEGFARAEAAFQRALDLNPELNLAHSFYAQMETDLGRAPQAMVRLLQRTRANGNDPNLFSGLVYACRFCGLLNASIAAHQHARRLDPLIPTSVAHSYYMAGDYRLCLENAGNDFLINPLALVDLGREEEALDLVRRDVAALELSLTQEHTSHHELFYRFGIALRALLEGKRAESLRALDSTKEWRTGSEELYHQSRHLARLGESEGAVAVLEQAVQLGFICYPAMVRDPWLDPLRVAPRFTAILCEVQSRHEEARRMFIEAEGIQILGAP